MPRRPQPAFRAVRPGALKPFDYEEIAGWFKPSPERIFSATPPLAEFSVSAMLKEGTHPIEVPAEFHGVEEVLIPAQYGAKTKDDAAAAIYVVYPHAGLVEVLPQRWFTPSQFDVGMQWITRLARDPVSAPHHRRGHALWQLRVDRRRSRPGVHDRGLKTHSRSDPSFVTLLVLDNPHNPIEPLYSIEAIKAVAVLRLVSDDGTNRLTRARVDALTAAVLELCSTASHPSRHHWQRALLLRRSRSPRNRGATRAPKPSASRTWVSD